MLAAPNCHCLARPMKIPVHARRIMFNLSCRCIYPYSGASANCVPSLIRLTQRGTVGRRGVLFPYCLWFALKIDAASEIIPLEKVSLDHYHSKTSDICSVQLSNCPPPEICRTNTSSRYRTLTATAQMPEEACPTCRAGKQCLCEVQCCYTPLETDPIRHQVRISALTVPAFCHTGHLIA